MIFNPKWYRNPQHKWYRIINNNKQKAATPPIDKWKNMGIYFPDGYPELWVDINHDKTPVHARDMAGRTQYQYWTRTKEINRRQHWGRFYEIGPTFWNNLIPLLQMPFPINQKTWPDGDIYRLMLIFLIHCGIRAGYPKYRDQNNSFGVCTLEWEHLRPVPSWDYPIKIEIGFPGKKQVINTCECKLTGGEWERVFIAYLSCRRKQGRLRKTDPVWLTSDKQEIYPTVLLEYLHEHVHPKITIKDLRTWLVHHHVWDSLQKLGGSHNLTDTVRKAEWRRVIKEIALKMHHTPTVCQSSYICPSMKDAWMKGNIPFRGGESREQRWFRIWWARDSRR